MRRIGFGTGPFGPGFIRGYRPGYPLYGRPFGSPWQSSPGSPFFGQAPAGYSTFPFCGYGPRMDPSDWVPAGSR